jgi:hypothetical protein
MFEVEVKVKVEICLMVQGALYSSQRLYSFSNWLTIAIWPFVINLNIKF